MHGSYSWQGQMPSLTDSGGLNAKSHPHVGRVFFPHTPNTSPNGTESPCLSTFPMVRCFSNRSPSETSIYTGVLGFLVRCRMIFITKKPCETSRPTWLGKKNVPLCFRFCDGLLGYDTIWTKTSVVNRLWRMRRHHYVKNEFVQSLPAQDNPRCCRQPSTNQWALRSRYKHSFSWWFDFNDACSVGFSASAILLSFRV